MTLAACTPVEIPPIRTLALTPTLNAPASVMVDVSTVGLSIPTHTAPPTALPGQTATPEQAVLPTETTIPQPTAVPPTPDAQARLRTVRLPILMYHYIEPWPAEADTYRQSLTVTPEAFAAQMQYLHDNGFTAVSLYDLAEAIALGVPLPEKAVAITFDDGYRGLMAHAAPVMQRHGFAGTVFVITEFADFDQPQYLSWSQLKELFALGWDIEPHTKTHIELAGRPRDVQLYQMLGSIETIEANLGVRPRFICYPAGKFDEATLQLASEMSLWGGVTTTNGRVHGFGDRFRWTRVRVDGRYGLDNFIYAVTSNE